MEVLKTIVASYGIDLMTIKKIKDSTYLVEARNKKYCLKKSSIKKEDISKWENVFHQSYKKNINNILPVYKTLKGQLFVESNELIYYLTPWMEKSETSIKKVYKSIGNIHYQSKHNFTLSTTEVSKSFEAYKRYCEDLQKALLENVKAYETRRYMSPFELQVCTHYRDIRLSLHKMKNRLDDIFNNDDEYIWSYSLCHNDLKYSNIFMSNGTWITNWDQATYNHSIIDLVKFFSNEVIYYDAQTEQLIDSFQFYMEKNKLTADELRLLTIYLLDPTSYMNMIKKYDQNLSSDTMINFVKQLQEAYRIILFAIDFTNYIEKEYETVTLDDLEI